MYVSVSTCVSKAMCVCMRMCVHVCMCVSVRVVYSILQSSGVILTASLRTLSMRQLKRSGESMQPCLTPLTTLNSSDATSVVLTWDHVLVYIVLMISTRWLATL